MIYNKSHETSGNVSLVVFIDGTTVILNNYNNGISFQQNFSVAVNLDKNPQSAYMISPDFDGKKVYRMTIKITS